MQRTDTPKSLYVDLLPRRVKLRRLVWTAGYVLLFRPTPRWTLHGWRRMVLRMFGAHIGVGSKIAPSCRIWAPWNLRLGNFTALAENVDCYCVAPITIGSHVAVSQRTFLCAATHDISTLRRELVVAPIRIGDHAWVAAEAFVGPGVSIGEGAVVGARAAVFKDVAPWQVAIGCPAKILKTRVIRDEHPTPPSPPADGM